MWEGPGKEGQVLFRWKGGLVSSLYARRVILKCLLLVLSCLAGGGNGCASMGLQVQYFSFDALSGFLFHKFFEID